MTHRLRVPRPEAGAALYTIVTYAMSVVLSVLVFTLSASAQTNTAANAPPVVLVQPAELRALAPQSDYVGRVAVFDKVELRARVVINATGIFTDAVRRLDDQAAASLVTTSQGAHIVLDRSFLPGDSEIGRAHV